MKLTAKIISCHSHRMRFTRSSSDYQSVTMIPLILTALLLAPLSGRLALSAGGLIEVLEPLEEVALGCHEWA